MRIDNLCCKSVSDFCLDLKTFSAVMCALGDRIAPALLKELFEELDADGSGNLDFVEFVELW